MLVETPLLVVGSGPAALVVAKLAAGAGLPCLLAGHEAHHDLEPTTLTPAAIEVLERQRLLDVLRPYLHSTEPAAISPLVFEDVVKHHCIADVNVTVYDAIEFVEREIDGVRLRGVFTDGTSRWRLHADRFVDVSRLPSGLCEAIVAAAAALDTVITSAR